MPRACHHQHKGENSFHFKMTHYRRSRLLAPATRAFHRAHFPMDIFIDTRLSRALLVAAVLLHSGLALSTAEDLGSHATVGTAITTTIRPSSAAAIGAVGYLGVQ